MSTANSSQGGFSTVEIVVTLFVATAFLIAGYQLYRMLVVSSAEAQWQSRASNIAHDAIRRVSAEVGPTCSATTTPGNLPSIPSGSLPSPTSITASVTCPRGASSSLSRVTVTVQYGSPERRVVYANDATLRE